MRGSTNTRGKRRVELAGFGWSDGRCPENPSKADLRTRYVPQPLPQVSVPISRPPTTTSHSFDITITAIMQLTFIATALFALLPLVAATPTPTSGKPTLTTRAIAPNYSKCVGNDKKIALTFDDGYVLIDPLISPSPPARPVGSRLRFARSLSYDRQLTNLQLIYSPYAFDGS